MSATPGPDDVARSARRKVAWRLLPLLLVLYVISYLDRANAGYAKLQMQDDLNFADPDAVFGNGFAVFFVGYLFLEIPGALLVEHWSARKWFTRILVTWGLCSMGMALVRTPGQFYLARFLLGLAEAGFFPGVMVYFSHWFPRRDRARAMAVMLFGVPGSQALGAYVSGKLLEQSWLDLAGWQWVFLVEGAPAVLLGIALPFLMTDRPARARWLTPAERDWLEGTLAAERREVAARGGMSLRQALRQRTVWLLAFGIFATNTGGYALVFWLPTVVKGLLTAMRGGVSDQDVLRWTGLIYACGLLAVWLSGQSSDRSGERKWHCALALMLAGAALAGSAIPDQPWAAVFAWLCLVGFFANFWMSPYWALPTQVLTASAAAVSIGFINMCANLAGIVGPWAVGRLKSRGPAGILDPLGRFEWQTQPFGERDCLLFLAACYVVGGTALALLRVRRDRGPAGSL